MDFFGCLSRGNIVQPSQKELVSHGQDNGADEEADDAHGHESPDHTKENYSDGNFASATQQERLEDVVHQSDEDAPHEEDDRGGSAGNGEGIGDGRHEDNNACLKNCAHQEDGWPE